MQCSAFQRLSASHLEQAEAEQRDFSKGSIESEFDGNAVISLRKVLAHFGLTRFEPARFVSRQGRAMTLRSRSLNVASFYAEPILLKADSVVDSPHRELAAVGV